MSFVIASIMKNSIIMLGDTQLNDNVRKCAIRETTIKVFPLDEKTLLGVTGDFETHCDIINILNNDLSFSDLSFEDKIYYIKHFIGKRDNNIVLATLENNDAKFVVMGTDYGYNLPIETLKTDASIKLLLPPNVTEQMCKPYIYSLSNIEKQMFSCIEAVSNWSDTVNNKIVGFKVTQEKCELLMKNTNYQDINHRIVFK